MKNIINNIAGLLGLFLFALLLLIVFILWYIKDIPTKILCFFSPKYKLRYEQKCKEKEEMERKKFNESTINRGWAFQDLR